MSLYNDSNNVRYEPKTEGGDQMHNTARKVLYAMLAAQRYPWEQGVAAQAAYENGWKEIWLPMAYDAIQRALPDGRLAMMGQSVPVADAAAVGEVCFRAFEETGDAYFRNGADGMLDYLLNRAPKTETGLICHNTESFHDGFTPYQLWVDGMYMVPPFLAVMGELDEAVRQLDGYREALTDRDTRLLCHILDSGNGRFVRDAHWATGNGWALMGMVRVAAEAKKQGRKDLEEQLAGWLREHICVLMKYQTEDGRFHDILDDPDSFTDGTSALMFAYTVYRCIREGWLPEGYRTAADRAFESAEKRIDGMGILREVCGNPDFLQQGTSVEAQAAYLLAYSQKTKE